MGNGPQFGKIEKSRISFDRMQDPKDSIQARSVLGRSFQRNQHGIDTVEPFATFHDEFLKDLLIVGHGYRFGSGRRFRSLRKKSLNDRCDANERVSARSTPFA